MIKYVLFYVAVLIYLVLVPFAAAFSNCDEDSESEQNYIKDLRITGCHVDSEKCNLIRGTNVTIEIDFIAKSNSNTINTIVYGVLAQVPVPFPLDNPDGCKDSGITCPITEGQEYHYISEMFVQKAYPKLNVDVKWELRDDDGKLLVCILIPSKLK